MEVLGHVKDPNCRREETVHVAGGFGPDGSQPPARGESDKKSVTTMGGVGHNQQLHQQQTFKTVEPEHYKRTNSLSYKQRKSIKTSAQNTKKIKEENV